MLLYLFLGGCAATDLSPRVVAAAPTDAEVAAAASVGQPVVFRAARDEQGLALTPDHDVARSAEERERESELLVANVAKRVGVERGDLKATEPSGHRMHTFECFGQTTPVTHLPTAFSVCITRRLSDGAYAWVSVNLSRDMIESGSRAKVTPEAAQKIARDVVTQAVTPGCQVEPPGPALLSLEGSAPIYRIAVIVMCDDIDSVSVVVDAENGAVREKMRRRVE